MFLKARTHGFRIKCDQGHVYSKTTAEIKNGCPKCNRPVFVGQERTREILKHHFGLEFHAARPEWLRNPKTGACLELDGYNEELKVAFEFQGRQHFSEKTPFSTDFEQQKERDKFKKEQCAINGVKLIEVLQPTSYDTMKFFESIQRDFKKGGVELKIKQEKVEDMFNAVVSSKQSETMVAFKFFVESKGCKLLSEKMINTTEVLEFECDKGHRFHSSAERFRQKYGTSYNSKESKMIPHACNQCKAELNPSKTRTMYTRKDYEEIGKSKGWTLTSEKIGGKYEMVNWQCQNGHERSVALRSMLSPAFRSNCAACASMKTSILPESVLNGGQTNVSSTIESAGNEQEKEDSSEQVMARQMLVDLTQTMCDLAHKAGQYASMLKSPEVATEYERLKAVVLGLSSATNTRGRKLT